VLQDSLRFRSERAVPLASNPFRRLRFPFADRSLENECRAVINAESIGKPISLSREVAEMTYLETGTEEAGYFEATPFVGTILRSPHNPSPATADRSSTWSKRTAKDAISSRLPIHGL